MQDPAPAPTLRHRVVVIGSGFGGLFTTQALKGADVAVTLVAKTSHHLFQPLLYQVATGVLSQGEIAPSTREILARQRNARVILGDVTGIDLERRVVTSQVLDRVTETPYDSLVLAAGAGQSYFGNDHFSDYAPGMKSIDDALELRARIFGAFEQAEISDDPEEVRRLLTFVVVGAGPTGVEMAGQIAELAHRALDREFRSIDTRSSRVILLDAGPVVLPAFGDRLGRKAIERLTAIGVEVKTSAAVTGVDAEGLTVESPDGHEERIEAVCKIWAAGVSASPLGAAVARQSGAEVDRAGRVLVEKDLTLPGHPEVFVIGDMIALDSLPGVAQVAIQGGRFAARRIIDRLAGEASDEPFVYKDKGSMATISRFSAVAVIGPLRVSGFVAWLLWLGVHLVYITGFKKRLTTLLHWAVSFIGRGRSERAITEQQATAREALELLGSSWTHLRSDAPLTTAQAERGEDADASHDDDAG